jgi:hypothetical protein
MEIPNNVTLSGFCKSAAADDFYNNFTPTGFAKPKRAQDPF